jgi:hypothetical protein
MNSTRKKIWILTVVLTSVTTPYTKCAILFTKAEIRGTRAGFLRVLWFPLPIFIPPISPQSPSPIIWGWYNRPVVAAVPKVAPHKLKQKAEIHLLWEYDKYCIIIMVKLFLCLTNNTLCHEGIWGSGCIDPHFLDLGTSWRWSASQPSRFTPGERAPITHWIGGWVDPRASLDDVEKILDPTRTWT